MNTTQLHQITPDELANLIKEGLKPELLEFVNQQVKARSEHPEILSRQQTADIFGISLVCLHDWMNKRIVKPYKMGNKTFFKYAELLETLHNSNRS